MKHYIAAVICFAAPAAAQDRMTLAECTQSWAAFAGLTAGTLAQTDVQVDADSWCSVSNLDVQTDPKIGFRVGALRWRGSDFARFIDDGLPPRAVDIEARDIMITPATGDPVLDYLMGVQMSGTQVGFGLSVRWDGVQDAVILDSAYIDLANENRIDATARIDGVDLTDRASIQASVGRFGVADITLTSQFNGWFEEYVVMVIGPMMLTNSDVTPQEQVVTLKRQAVDIIQSISDEIMPAVSRDAVSAFVAAVPLPKGVAQLQFSAAPPIGMASLAPILLTGQRPTASQAINRLLSGTKLLMTWTDTEGAQ